MKLILISNIISCVCALIGYIYASLKFFKPQKAVFPQMIALAVGCMAFGKLYQVVRLLTEGEIFGEFQLGVFGIIGSLLFFFSANFGSMDNLADDKSKALLKYRLIALAAPIAAAALYVLFIYLIDLPPLAKIIAAIITVLNMMAGYYHLKHLILPDVEHGVIRCLRTYNLLALVYGYLCMVEMIVLGTGNGVAILACGVLMGLLPIGIVISVKRGMKKWTI